MAENKSLLFRFRAWWKRAASAIFVRSAWFRWLLAGAFALVVCVLALSPAQSGVMLYKFAIVCAAVVLGVAVDLVLFPFSDPASYLSDVWQDDPDADNPDDADYPVAQGYNMVFCMAMLRRALVVCAVVLGVGLGL